MRLILIRALLAGTGAVVGAGGTIVATTVISDDERGTIRAHLVESVDATCLATGPANRDTVGKFYLRSTKPTMAQRRASARMDSLFAHRCVVHTLVVDTLLPTLPDSEPTPPDTSVQPDTLPTPPEPPPEPPPFDTTTTPPAPVDTSAVMRIIATIGPTKDPATASAFGGGWALMDPLWVKWEPVRWAADSSNWGNNYYDRGLIYYAMSARTGNATWRTRGDAIVLEYRRKYLHANNYQTSPHWSQLDGVALHYLLTNDDSSRIAVGKAAWNLSGTAQWSRTGPYTDARQQARALTGMVLAWQLNAPNAPTGGWVMALDKGLDAILPQQSADGAWRYPANTCDLSLNYMGAMLADALIRVYETYKPDPRIPVAVKKTADFLWTQWRPNDAVPSFNYYEAPCSNVHGNGGPSPTPDLTGLFTSTYAWMAKRDASYLAKSDAVISGTMRGIYANGSKQFNQAFTYSWRALGYLP